MIPSTSQLLFFFFQTSDIIFLNSRSGWSWPARRRWRRKVPPTAAGARRASTSVCSVTCFALIGLRCQQLSKGLCKKAASTRLHEYLSVGVCRTSGRRVAQASLHLLVDHLRTQRRVRRGFRSRPQQQANLRRASWAVGLPSFISMHPTRAALWVAFPFSVKKTSCSSLFILFSAFHSMGEWGNQSLSPCAFHYQLLCSDCNYWSHHYLRQTGVTHFNHMPGESGGVGLG